MAADTIQTVARSLSALATTTANFTQPAASSSVTVAVDSTAGFVATQTVYVSGGGFYTVAAIVDGTHVSLTNTGVVGNAAPAATVPFFAAITPAPATGSGGLPAQLWGAKTASPGAPPTVAGGGWTLIGGSPSTSFTDAGPTIVLFNPGSDPPTATVNAEVRALAATANYQHDIAFLSLVAAAGSQAAGFCLRDSASGKIIVVQMTSGGGTLQMSKYSDPNTWAGDLLNVNLGASLPFPIVRVKDDGTNVIYSVSRDGSTFCQILTYTRAAAFCIPDQWGPHLLASGANDAACTVWGFS